MRRSRLRSVHARTTLIATVVVTVVLVGAVAGLVYGVERTLVSRIQEQAEAEVQAVANRLTAGLSPEEALQPVNDPDLVGGNVFTYVAILDEEGHPVVGSGFFAIAGVEGVTVGGLPGMPRVVSVGETDLAIAQRSIAIDGQTLFVVAASPLAEVVRSIDAIVRLAVVGVPLLVVLVAVVTWSATGRTLQPIEAIRTEVEALSSRTLDRRVPVPDTQDEVARLAETMNGMLARLEAAAARQREFVSDASHELRSPVASIRAELEVALAHPEAGGWRETATGVLSETGRLERLIEDLLLLARLDEGAAPSATGVVEVGPLAREAAARAIGPPVDLDVEDGLLVRGTQGELASVLRNLLDNAVRHAASTVVLTARAADGTVIVTVDDDGPGIPSVDRERVLQRFTRLERGRSRADGGVGLGLAVVDRVVRNRDGTVVVSDSPCGGTRVTVTLHRAVPATDG